MIRLLINKLLYRLFGYVEKRDTLRFTLLDVSERNLSCEEFNEVSEVIFENKFGYSRTG